MTVRFSGALNLGLGPGRGASERWLALLAQLQHTRSIAAAARAAGLSYKAAWDAVEAMNNLADGPLVARSVGGRGGGGTCLTARGRALVQTFEAVRQAHTRFFEQVNRELSPSQQRQELATGLATLRRFDMRTSARNQFAGVVRRIRTGAVNDEIEVALAGGARLVAIITRASTAHLELAVKTPVTALVKASWVMIVLAGADGAPPRLSARNCLEGTVSRVVRGAVNCEVIVALPGGNTIAASITQASARALKLARGRRVQAVFKASSVILARAQ